MLLLSTVLNDMICRLHCCRRGKSFCYF